MNYMNSKRWIQDTSTPKFFVDKVNGKVDAFISLFLWYNKKLQASTLSKIFSPGYLAQGYLFLFTWY